MTPFELSALPPEAFKYERYMAAPFGLAKADAKRVVQAMKQEKVYLNDTYQVNVEPPVSFPNFPTIVHLSIKRRDRAPIHDWRDLQTIKNMLVGAEHEGVELYPAESRLVDTANQYHLFVLLDPTKRFPFGFRERLVMNAEAAATINAVQRPLVDDFPATTQGEQQP